MNSQNALVACLGVAGACYLVVAVLDLFAGEAGTFMWALQLVSGLGFMVAAGAMCLSASRDR
ncbi:hypothetical protein GEV27_05445 [Aeromicrobium sp. S22]|uniref:hypothetical protein n=1 Tax=Aeromicrobium sp. S22 TaxID=2662029 RepID=UPI00129D67B8|nr:hypothetical protein [Aeromicrobium sp. S22]MRK00960.1 hypothetical protein [Aeromicrobium sp. S22]